MAKMYTAEEREEALKLAGEIGTPSAAERLGINLDTLYNWRNRKRQREEVEAQKPRPSPEEKDTEITRLQKELKEKQEEVEILRAAVGFFARSQKK